MMHNISVKDIIFGVTVWISGALIVTILSELIEGWSGISNMIFALSESLTIIGLVAFFCTYSKAKGKMQGILDGIATERKTWRDWYKQHQEEVKSHGITFETPSSSMLQCPHCGGNHD